MYRQASILLNKKDSIVEMPFKPNTFMVESDKGMPHYVVLAESGKVTNMRAFYQRRRKVQ